MTVANGKWPPSHDLHSSNNHGHKTNQVEHDTVEALQGAEKEKNCV